ncbi:hypothetical protein [Neomegalonema sp.]|uniref:c-type cytochrome n=1 Tax=Neomegalonema sp. TaxID=2039713 RepID=UPI0026319381|nr:hypothetical protein [Neomegalonema sp.]MDD2866959.1 hypothetical protein [Neomegalonema sp.]
MTPAAFLIAAAFAALLRGGVFPQAAPEPLQAPAPAAEAAPDPEYGAWLAEACAACHGGATPGVPALEGRSFAELRAALEAYASGARTHDQMGVVARSLTPEERGHVAAWFAGRPAEP